MPTYVYRCEKCGEFTEFHNINQQLNKCPVCKRKVERLIKSGNFILKEGNFYRKQIK